MKAPNYMNAAQIIHAIKFALHNAELLDPSIPVPEIVRWACHTQRIKREMLKLGATKWHGTLMLESTAATQFIASHVPDNAQGCDAQNADATRPNG